MGTILSIPPYTQFLQPQKRFQAVFNAVSPGKYDFGVPANTGLNFLPMKKQNLYLFDTFSFSADMAEGTWLKAVDTINNEVSTKLSIRVPSQTNKLIYRGKIPVINYIDNSDVQFYAYAEQEESLQISFEGILSQVSELVGELNIFAQLTCNVYEIRNKDWINNFFARTKNGQGKNLV